MAEAIFAAGNAPAPRPAPLPPADLVGQLKPIEAALRAAALVVGDGATVRPLLDSAAARLLTTCEALDGAGTVPDSTLGTLERVEEKLYEAGRLLGADAPARLLVDDALGRLQLAYGGLDGPLAERKTGETPAQPAGRPYFTTDPERLKLIHAAGAQIDGLLGLLIDAGTDPGPDVDALLGTLVRARDLAGAVIYATSDDGDDIETLHRTVYGTQRTARAAS